jgi:hypothetical protein
MRGHPELDRVVNLYRLARVAVRHAKGQCEAFWAEILGQSASVCIANPMLVD